MTDAEKTVKHVLDRMIRQGTCYRCPYCGQVMMGGKDYQGFYNCDNCMMCWTGKEGDKHG